MPKIAYLWHKSSKNLYKAPESGPFHEKTGILDGRLGNAQTAGHILRRICVERVEMTAQKNGHEAALS